MNSENTVIFKNPYTFEGKEYTELDLSGILELSGQDLIEAEQIFSTSGNFSVLPEMSVGYSFIIAARATKLPIEFFNGLPAPDALKVKNKVMSFLNN